MPKQILPYTSQSEYIHRKAPQPTKALKADIIHNILEQHALEFSEKAIRRIVKASKNFDLNKSDHHITMSEKRRRLEILKTTAMQLSSMLREWHPYLEADPEDKTLAIIEHLIQNCDTSLDYYRKQKPLGGAPLKSLSLKLFVQLLILTYEEETGEKYIIEEPTSYGRQRTYYNHQVYEFAKSILGYVVPDEDPSELLKMARREPLPLDWTRKMKEIVDEDFHEIK